MQITMKAIPKSHGLKYSYAGWQAVKMNQTDIFIVLENFNLQIVSTFFIWSFFFFIKFAIIF